MNTQEGSRQTQQLELITDTFPAPYINLNKSRRVLLVEPEYKAKYPPLALMKISTYHKERGDKVEFFKGTNASIRNQQWDVIYITTLFTFLWRTTINTIEFYKRKKQKHTVIKVGGILASLLHKELEYETGITPHFGLWKEVDTLPPDYSLFNGQYQYRTNNASLGYMTKGCINLCPFCAVPKLEPDFIPFIPLGHQIDPSKKDLVLLDNNVLASSEFPRIVQEIKDHGFYKGAKWGRQGHRYVDFNQGVDARLLSEDKMDLLSGLALKPLRIAFDNINLESLYVEKIRLAHKCGINQLSNYILFNHNDTPEDFYRRLRVNIELNEELGLSIFSFPMRYIPLDSKDRRYVSPKWSNTQLRGIQCILHATHGVVGSKKPFFEKAFGKDVSEFLYIIEQPEELIFKRNKMKTFSPDLVVA